MSIQLQFVCEAALSSRAIAWFSAGHLSHVDAVLDDGNLLGARDDRVGGKPSGVQIRPQGYIKFSRRVVMTVPTSPLQSKSFYTFLISQIGKPYDKEAIWAFMFNRNWRADDSWICSELVTAAGEKSGILPALYLAANKITPVSCAVAFSAVEGTVRPSTAYATRPTA
jgi:hypothetical protein